MKKLFAFLLAMTMLFAFAACTAPAVEVPAVDKASGQEEDSLSISSLARLIMVTGGDSGTYYAFGGVIANVLSSTVDNLEITAGTSGVRWLLAPWMPTAADKGALYASLVV